MNQYDSLNCIGPSAFSLIMVSYRLEGKEWGKIDMKIDMKVIKGALSMGYIS